MVEQIFPAAHGGPVAEQRKTMGEKENCYVLVMIPNPKCPCTAQDEGEETGVKE